MIDCKYADASQNLKPKIRNLQFDYLLRVKETDGTCKAPAKEAARMSGAT